MFLSNGLLDPWSSGGVLKNISKTVRAVIIPEGAHHLDLRFSNPADPVSIRIARSYYKVQIKKWIKQFHVERSNFFLKHKVDALVKRAENVPDAFIR